MAGWRDDAYGDTPARPDRSDGVAALQKKEGRSFDISYPLEKQ